MKSVALSDTKHLVFHSKKKSLLETCFMVLVFLSVVQIISGHYEKEFTKTSIKLISSTCAGSICTHVQCSNSLTTNEAHTLTHIYCPILIVNDIFRKLKLFT